MKESIEALAFFGGEPAFAEDQHVGRPNIGDEEMVLGRVRQALRTRWLTNDGPYVLEFERRVSDMLGVRHCVATSSGTMGLELAVKAAGLSGEVIVPSFTFVGTVHALTWLGITPVFCDIDPATHTIDPRRVEPLITPKTSGILGVHLWGRPCDVEALQSIASSSNLTLLFDAAHAFGCSHGGAMVGAFGAAEVFSFHATKVCNAFEGGAVTTNDDEFADAVRIMRNFGFAGEDDVRTLGTNGKMNEASAAMGLTSVESIGDFIAHNERNYRTYRSHLSGIPGIKILSYDELDRHNYHYVVITVDEAAAGLTRDHLHRLLTAERVLARRYFYPGCHRCEPYRSQFSNVGQRLGSTEFVASRVLCLPTGTAVSDNDIAAICALIRFCVANSYQVSGRIRPLERPERA